MTDNKNEKEKQASVFTLQNFSSTTKLAASSVTINEKDDLYDPFDERNPSHPNTDSGALIHLLKGSLGTGILSMPNAFKNGGLLFGAIGTLVVGFVCTHCVHILVKSSHELCKREKTPSLGFAETAEAAFKNGPPQVSGMATFARKFVNVALVVTYFSGNCVYVVFISTSVQQLVDYYVRGIVEEGDGDTVISLRLYMVMLLVLLIPISQIRELKYLVPFSGIANFSMMAALGITFYYMFKDVQDMGDRDQFTKVTQLPIFFTTVIFAMEGIGVIMPIENSMKNPHHFLGCPGVLNVAMSIVVSLYALVGFFGYLRYGPDTKASISLNLPIEEIPAQIAKVLIPFSILLTYALQFFVPMEIVWDLLKDCFPQRWKNIAQILVRTLAVIGTVAIAAVVPDLEDFIGLVGAICFSILGIATPAIVETVTCWGHDLGKCKWKLVKNIILIIFAVLALVTGTYTSLKKIIELYTK